jgi:hypothetical protein
MSRTLASLALAASLVLATTIVVLAQTSSLPVPASTFVSFDWGAALGALGTQLVPWAATALLALVIALLPAPVRAFLTTQRTAQVEQLLERALGYGVAQVEDAAKGHPLSVDVKNEVLASAIQYALDHGSKALLDFVQKDAIPQKLEARVATSPAVLSLTSPTQMGATSTVKVG